MAGRTHWAIEESTGDVVLYDQSSNVRCRFVRALGWKIKTPLVWKDLTIPLTATKGGGIRDPGFAKFQDDGAGSTGIYAHAFDATAEEELFFEQRIPHCYATGTDLRPHVHWSPSDGAAGNVVWGLEYVLAQNGGAAVANTTIITGTDAAAEVDKAMQHADLGTISGVGVDSSFLIMGRVFRKAADVADTYAADAWLHTLNIHHQCDQHGTFDIDGD